ncbi:MAG TPA: type VI secretion system baseplate subunit TssK [Thermoanaerobaculia bacterium]|nr:type VI secretion system baseplate subunit TssK [Thermoanaerobaculia bacterium]
MDDPNQSAPERPDPVRTENGRTESKGRRAQRVMAAHDLPLAIQWHEGMLLAPQHFQQMVLRQDALLAYHAALCSPYHWGVRHLRIDPVYLVDGVVRVLEVEAVMPDGLVVSAQAGEGPDLAVDLSPQAEAMREKPATVHLAVAALQARGTTPQDGDRSRYESTEDEPVPDLNTGEGELRLPRLKPRLRLLVGEEPPAKYVSFPLVRVAYRNETFERVPDFAPPTLRVTLDSPLGKLCVGIAQRLREKAVFLADQVRSPSLAMRVPQLLEAKNLTASMVAALPPFEALLYSGQAHPFPLYLALCSLVGSVAAVGKSLLPPQLEPYDHHRLWATFEQARSFVFQALDEGILQSYTGYPFLYKDGSYLLPLDPEWTGRRLVLGVRGRDGVSEADSVAWVETALVASRPMISVARSKVVTGAERQRIEGEGDLLPSRGVTLWTLPSESEYLVPGELLEIRNLDDAEGRRRPLEIILYVRNKPAVGPSAGPTTK